jgi:8-oxo-dGTP pyrophosphatase MutT (NUDIX family)
MPDFEQRLRDALEAHPPNRRRIEDSRAAAVLIPVVAGDPPTLIFTVRTDTVRSHKGQISFPGGSEDEGEGLERTALRETHEEIGLDPSAVKILGELDTFPTFVSGYAVTPFVGWLDSPPDLAPNPAEVAAILEVPLTDLNQEIRADPGFTHNGRTYPTEAWIWREHVIWGVTAYVLRRFLGILGSHGIIDPPEGDPDWLREPLP